MDCKILYERQAFDDYRHDHFLKFGFIKISLTNGFFLKCLQTTAHSSSTWICHNGRERQPFWNHTSGHIRSGVLPIDRKNSEFNAMITFGSNFLFVVVWYREAMITMNDCSSWSTNVNTFTWCRPLSMVGTFFDLRCALVSPNLEISIMHFKRFWRQKQCWTHN